MKRHMRQRYVKRAAAAGLSALLAFGNTGMTAVLGTAGVLTVFGAENETVFIDTVEAFLEFQRECAEESYSKGRTFSLTTDLNLAGISLTAAPVFAGTFDGGGHGIYGVCVDSNGSDQGLFRFVAEGAVVRNLSVSGKVTPGGSAMRVGGIVGTNRGLLEHVSFSGRVSGQEEVGGIAGFNEASGIIRACQNQGEIGGNRKTGGIAGSNEGTITGSKNSGAINPSGESAPKSGSQDMALDAKSLAESWKAEQINDAGGIAGFSMGILENCQNDGDVGYPHTGYNLGGIVGRQSGQVISCINSGQIWGRKDTGGIVGQLEPSLSIEYAEDLYGELKGQLDDLAETGKSLTQSLEDTGETAGENLREAGRQVERIRDLGRSYKDLFGEDYDTFDQELGRSVDEIQNILYGLDVTILDGPTRRLFEKLQKQAEHQKELKEKLSRPYEGDPADLAARKEWLAMRIQVLSELLEGARDMAQTSRELLKSGAADAVEWDQDLQDDMNDLQNAADDMVEEIQDNLDWFSGDLSSLDEDLSGEMDQTSQKLHRLSDDLEAGSQEMKEQRKQLERQIDQIRDTIANRAEERKQDDDGWLEDVSAQENGEGDGLIQDCVNEGAVFSDYQVGGIAGIIGMELSLDPEQDLNPDEERTLNVIGKMRAVVRGCRNSGEIQAKNSYAGGIVGKANLGALMGNENYGDVAAEGGAYVGGITGSSDSLLKGNYAMCAAEGSQFVGGIAGWARDLQENFAMVTLLADGGENLGMIAGQCDKAGEISGNGYVREAKSAVGAIDGITYENQAQAMDYEEFVALDHMPEEFSTMTVTFVVEGDIVRTVTCGYGEGVKEEEIPTLPQKDGYYYEWQKKDLSHITSNQRVEAVYKPWSTTIASSKDKKPFLLAEANFYPGTALVAEEKGADGFSAPHGYRILTVYDVKISQPGGISLPETMTLRVLAEESKKVCQVGIVRDGAVTLADTRRDGDYLVFSVSGPGTVAVLEKTDGTGRLMAVLAAVVLVAAGGIFLSRRRKKGEQKDENGELDGTSGGGDEAGGAVPVPEPEKGAGSVSSGSQDSGDSQGHRT